MSTAIAPLQDMPREQVELVKRTVAKGATDDELALFLYQAKRTGLDPLSRQIHFIKRWDATQGREVGTVQTGIDGLRLIANRTGRYRPDEEAARFTFEGPGRAGRLVSAKVRVYLGHGSEWFPVEAEAYYDEYLQTRKDKQTGELVATAMWKRMPRLMLAKCAEALALRKAFPAELSGIYAAEEFGDTSTGPGPVTVNTETGEVTDGAGETAAGGEQGLPADLQARAVSESSGALASEQATADLPSSPIQRLKRVAETLHQRDWEKCRTLVAAQARGIFHKGLDELTNEEVEHLADEIDALVQSRDSRGVKP